MLVKEVMTHPAKTITPETSLKDVASLMCLNRFSSLPVIEGDSKLVGILAERDVLRYLFPSLQDVMKGISYFDFENMESDYKKILSLKVADLMSSNIITVRPDIPLLRAVSIMARNNFRRIPVAEGEQLLGVISLGDIHRAIFIKSFSES